MQYKRSRIAIVVAVVAVAVAVPVVASAGKPVIFDHESFVDGPNPDSWCGAVDGTSVFSGTFTFRQDASGAFHGTESTKGVFTASATGKSLELAEASLDMGIGVDNGDGTTTFTEKSAGLVIRFKIPNGPVFKDADGKPILGAGSASSVATIDNATGDLISLQETVNGPHPLRDGVDICTPTIAYLTS
jgi:hypothetical protein